MSDIATTPFGGGRFGASDFQARAWIEARRAAVAENSNDTGKANKWELLRALTEARAAFGLGNTTIHVLEVLLGFHQSKEIDGSTPIVVFPSNREICHRTRGMTDRNVRRHLRALVDASLVLRRDSPNGKRYCLRDSAGQVDEAFGFDLSPLALMASMIYEAAERVREHQRVVRKVRGEITLLLRDVDRIVGTAEAEGREGPWSTLRDRLRALSGRVGRFTALEEHQARHEALSELRKDVENAYLDTLSEQEMSANDGQDVRHIQNSNPESNLDTSYEEKKEENGEGTPTVAEPACGTSDPDVEAGVSAPDGGTTTQRPMAPIGLGLFRSACFEFASLMPEELRSWREVVDRADVARAMLGISTDAMHKARKAMGPVEAAITVACILQRHEAIKSPGGYLRALTARAVDGKFSVRPMVDALVPK